MPEIQSIQRLQLEETPQPPSLSLSISFCHLPTEANGFSNKSMQICLYKSNSQAQFQFQNQNQIEFKENCNSLKLQALPMLYSLLLPLLQLTIEADTFHHLLASLSSDIQSAQSTDSATN